MNGAGVCFRGTFCARFCCFGCAVVDRVEARLARCRTLLCLRRRFIAATEASGLFFRCSSCCCNVTCCLMRPFIHRFLRGNIRWLSGTHEVLHEVHSSIVPANQIGVLLYGPRFRAPLPLPPFPLWGIIAPFCFFLFFFRVVHTHAKMTGLPLYRWSA